MTFSRFAGWIAAFLLLAQSALGRTISVSEIHYNPLEGADYEFIELINLTTQNQVLTGARFTNGIEFTFPNTVLGPSSRIVIPRDPGKFSDRYGKSIPTTTSGYKGRLDDQGEEVALVTATGTLLFRCKYDSGGDWPSRPDGQGSSLECTDPDADLSAAKNWRASTEFGGSPGSPGIDPIPTVVINEILAHTDPPLEDAIELLNLTDQRIDLSGWYLSNNRSNPRKYRFPSGSFIEPRSFRVVYEYQFNPRQSDPTPPPGSVIDSFTFNAANGDEACLVSANTDGSPKRWIDTLSFDPSENGYSFGRWPDGTGPWVTLSDLSFGSPVRAHFPESFLSEFRKGLGATNPLPRVGPIVIQSIQYQPADGADEFIELLNITSGQVAMFDPQFPANTWRIRGGVDFDLPQSIVLPPQGRVVLSGLPPATFRQRYSIPAEVPVLGPWTNQLNNAGEKISLFKPDPPQMPPHPDAGLVPYILVEAIDYKPEAPWPTEADGTGNPLVRIRPGSYGNDPLNWRAGTVTQTPLISLRRSASGWILDVQGTPGAMYTLETSTRLGPSAWTRGPSRTLSAQGRAAFEGSYNVEKEFLRVVSP